MAALDGVVLRIRAAIQQKYGVAVEQLFQVAAIDNHQAKKSRLELRLDSPTPTPLMDYVTGFYVDYEEMIKQIVFNGDPVGLPYSDSIMFLEWQTADGKMLEKLKELLTLPTFETSELAKTYKNLMDGGVSKEMRLRLSRRPSSGIDGRIL